MGALQVPDVSGSSLEDAALAYAQAGFFVLPVAHGKHPGSIVGKGWPDKSTTDAEQIADWWDEKSDAGIAIHTGASGLTFFDLDTDAVPEELAWLRTGIVQFSRAESVGSERGHYGFFTGDEIFNSGDLKLADGTKVGEIRSGNTVVIAAPSKHVHAETKNGEYRWRADDLSTPIPKLPSEARGYLRLRGIRKTADGHTPAMAGWCVEATDDAYREAFREWQSESRPKSLMNLVKWVQSADAATRNQTRDALRIAACESRVGFYPLADAVDGMRAAMLASYTQRGEPEKFDDGEFVRLVKNGVGYAMNRELDEISDEANRDYGAHHTESDFEDEVAREQRRLEVRAEAKRRFDSRERVPFSRTPMSLTELLAQPANPTPMRIDNVMQDQALVLFTAQYKAGKTTAVDNLIRSLVDADPFLGVFTVREPVKRLVLIDTEMSQDMVRTWLADQKIKNTSAVADVICLRGEVASFDILSDERRSEWAAYLREIGCDYLILDCLSPVLEALGLDENHDIGKFLIAFRALLAEAGIDGDATIVHHMGHTGERARGDSKLPGGADSIWKLVRDNPDDESSPSYFSANGRDVDVSQGLLHYDASTRRLTYNAVNRADAQKQRKSDQAAKEKQRKVGVAFPVILNLLRNAIKTKKASDEDGLSENKIIEEATKTDGVTRQAVLDALEMGAKSGELAHWIGNRKAKRYTIGTVLENED